MAPIALTGGRFDIFNDSSADEDTSTSTVDGPHAGVGALDQNNISPLRPVSVSNAQNRQIKSPTRVESLAAELKKLHLDNSPEIYHYKGRPIHQVKLKGQPGVHSARPPIRRDTFERLETVPEVEQRDPPEPEASSVSAGTQHYIELPAHQFSKHPLALSARKLTSVEEQLAKHRNGHFEWVLTVKVPEIPVPSDDSNKGDSSKPSSVKSLFFGCNILPSTSQPDKVASGKDFPSQTFTLLVTPLEGDREPIVTTPQEESQSSIAMAVGARPAVQATPVKAAQHVPEVRVEEISPPSDSKRGRVSVASVRVPSNSPPRIEDSVAALDLLEDELEAFDQAARFEKIVSPISDKSPKSSMQSLSAAAHHSPGAVSRMDRTSPRPVSSATHRNKPAEPRRSPTMQRSASMVVLDSPKSKEEDKPPLVQAPPKKSTNKGLASLQPPKPLIKSTKAPTMPTFELPGEAVARRLKEKREARLSMKATAEQAAAPTQSTIRRTKSARAPTVPKFELPGEAISRRKREEREARLRAQEEEERKRREFKARPIRSGTMPAGIPRETITSRARQKGALTENVGKSTTPSPKKRASVIITSREPLSHVDNQAQLRGRHLTTTEPSSTSLVRRNTSSSTNSLGSKRGSVSIEEVQQQRLRGKDIFQRDNSFSQDREKERREREAMARLAREQAAEQSRLRSREWAEKQKRKRMTVGSVRDLMA
ncbi:hypothetical protein PG996_004371 [Apiospora saccharicola]|uniref:Carboxylesterase family protein n=1 Tax=Apiospora saccharicola TaxID=335842 RepID=A0ABR1W6M9_9PEZI